MTTTTPTTGETTTFTALGLEPDLVEALARKGITHPFPIQEMTLGLALAGADIIGQARTGTGKTLGFGLPMLQRLDPDRGGDVQVLVIVPTRELCMQVAADLEDASAVKGTTVLAVYGGKSLDPQIEALAKRGVQVVVGTPGRLLDLLRRRVLDLSNVRGLVLDEADEMLDLGFLPDVEQLIEATHSDRQTLLFSATMPSAVVALARRYMHKPTFMRADVEEVHIGPDTEQHFFSCHRMDKPAVLARILQAPDRGLCVVFSRTKRMCDILAEELRERGIAASPIHSDLRQDARERALSRFRGGKVDVLVATEVAARGLDIDDVTHVVNYDCPDDEKMYLHRIGRTGRAGAAGVAITLAVWNELARLNMIKKALGIEVETHEVFSTSPILDELFDLPPRSERPRTAESTSAATVPRKRASRRNDDDGGRGQRGRRTTGRRRDPDTPDAEETAPAATPAVDDPPAVRRRSRRRSSGRHAAPAAADAGAAQPSADAGQPDGPRVRRRTRARAADPAISGTAAREATAGDDAAPADEAPAGDTSMRTRTRTRTRSTGDRSDRQRPGLDGTPAERSEEEAASSSTGVRRTRTRRSGGRSGADRDTSGPDRRAADDAERSQGEGEGSGGSRRRLEARDGDGRSSAAAEGRNSGRREGSRSGSGRGGRSNRSGNRGGRGGSGRSDGARGGDRQRRSTPVSSDEARGEGQPRLRRPLEVAHLP